MCRTPALGGKRLRCQACGAERYVYFSCGHSHCPLCQGNKRRAWYERVEDRLLQVPYIHITFTLPHELNGLCRLHPRRMYNLLLRTAWQTIRALCAQELDGLPGMTAVLHTWGSDLKHHVHAHCLVTFGALDENTGSWYWPRRRDRLVGYRRLRGAFKHHFLATLKAWMKTAPEPVYHQSYEVLTADLLAKTWVVNQQPPTADAQVINAYLSRYICRIGISSHRLQYRAPDEVIVEYKDYRRQVPGQVAPTAHRQLPPLLAIEQILQHMLPAHFHRSRHYGLHATPTRRRLAGQLAQRVQQNLDTIRLLFRLLKYLLLRPLPVCEDCGEVGLPAETLLPPNRHFLRLFLLNQERAPPANKGGGEAK